MKNKPANYRINTKALIKVVGLRLAERLIIYVMLNPLYTSSSNYKNAATTPKTLFFSSVL